MIREQLLKLVAEAGYDIGFGAKTHFATFDIVEKAPGWLGLASLVGGIYSLYVPFWSSQNVAAAFVIFGVISLYIGLYGAEKNRYEEVGKKLTQHFHELHALYRQVEALPSAADATSYLKKLEDIREKANSAGISKQIFLSDWYAHYKFFWQTQIGWIGESRPFGFFRDKVPLSAYLAAAFVAVFVLVSHYDFGSVKATVVPASPVSPASGPSK